MDSIIFAKQAGQVVSHLTNKCVCFMNAGIRVKRIIK